MIEPEDRFNAVLKKLLRLSFAANDANVLPPRYRDLWEHPDPIILAGMYHLLSPEETFDIDREAGLLENCLAEALERLHLPQPPERLTRDAAPYRVLISAWQEAVRSILRGAFPPCPFQG